MRHYNVKLKKLSLSYSVQINKLSMSMVGQADYALLKKEMIQLS